MADEDFEKPNKIFPSFYISGAEAATNLDLLYEYDITHILTVAADIKPKWPKKFKYLTISIYDMEQENIKQHFQKCNEFIEKGRADGAVLVHCVAGVSRSATICAAYILQKLKVNFDDAIGLVKDARPCICPNDGFIKQLKEYEKELGYHPAPDTTSPPADNSTSGTTTTTDTPSETPSDSPSPATNTVKEPEILLPPKIEPHTRYCCRMCGTLLFNDTDLLEHDVGAGQTSFEWRKRGNTGKVECTSFFLNEPTQFGDTSDLEGKLCCPKCNSRFGGWQWAGAQCSCGVWVTPAFQASKARIDPKPIIK